jgi:hypothetical protein
MKSGNLLLILSLTTASLGLSACGSSDDNKKTEDYSYEYSENGRETGKQTFNSLEELCLGLQNEELNSGNARSLRKAAFESKCSGTFTPFYPSRQNIHGGDLDGNGHRDRSERRERHPREDRAENDGQSGWVYQYTENERSTGKHRFATMSEMCEGLRNEKLNRGNARNLRRQAYEMMCGKTFRSF